MTSKHNNLFLVTSLAFIAIIVSPQVYAQNNATSPIGASDINNMTRYADPEGRFSINYPLNWMAQPATNRFQQDAVQFITPTNTVPWAIFRISVVSASLAQTNPETFLKSASIQPAGYSIFQQLECVKYKIEDIVGCSIILSGNTVGQVPSVVMFVASYVDKKMYEFEMIGSQDDFDSVLPTFQTMLASFKAPGTLPINIFLKATHSPQTGWVFTSNSSEASRSSGSGAAFNIPTIILKYDHFYSSHLINDDDDTRSLHNLNIDAFNVHTRSLGYLESQSVTFIANKVGTFVYYCNIHPEMRGLINVQQ